MTALRRLRRAAGAAALVVSGALAAAAAVVAWDAYGRPAPRVLVVLRCDDFSNWFKWPEAEKLAGACAAAGVPFQLAVIPAAAAREANVWVLVPIHPDRWAFLARGMKEGLIEASLHGLRHARTADNRPTEFATHPLEEQTDRLRRGLDMFREQLGVEPAAFVPPWHAFDADTLRAAVAVGLPRFSAGPLPLDMEAALDEWARAVGYLPALQRLNTVGAGISAAAASGDPHPAVVVMLHTYDLVHWSLEDLTAYLADLKSLPGARFATMREVWATEPGYTIGHYFDLIRFRDHWVHRRGRMADLGMDYDRLLPAGVHLSPAHLRRVAFRYHARRAAVWIVGAWVAAVAAWVGLAAAATVRRPAGNAAVAEKEEAPCPV